MKVKRMIAWLTVAAMLLSFCGCKAGVAGGQDVSYEALGLAVPMPAPLYANYCQPLYTGMSASGDAVFLPEHLAGFTPGSVVRGALWAYRDGKRAKLVDAKDLGEDKAVDRTFLSGSTLYFESDSRFFVFDLATQTTRLLFTSDEPVYSFQVLGDHMAYNSYQDGEDLLYLYDLKTKQVTKLCERLGSYCFVGTALRYITYDMSLEQYRLAEYDPQTGDTAVLLTFALPDEVYTVTAGYTEDLLIVENYMTNEDNDETETELWVYTLSDGSCKTYAMPSDLEVNRFVATQRYVYIQGCVETYDGTVYHRSYPIYRMDPLTGVCEKLLTSANEMNGGTLYVVSDDLLYFECSRISPIGQYICELYRYDVPAKNITKLMEY